MSNYRLKSSMIIYELERSIGKYLINKNNSILELNTTKEILDRVSQRADLDDINKIKLIIENSYLYELIQIALRSTLNSLDADYFKRLDNLFQTLEVFDIRNAIAHPNRDFPICYWYRCTVIAADPVIDSLGFFEVIVALENALQNKLLEPPEEWLDGKRWKIPTNIPKTLDHDVTGLVGRQQETSRLIKEIKSRKQNLLAVVAKGGVGKTSLMYEAISNLCLSNDVGSYFDKVIWTTLKQEKLTSSGLEFLSAPSSIDEMKIDIVQKASYISDIEYENFTDFVSKECNKRILLCLDNLETILRDSPATFEEFYELLPELWKVIVTSRIPVENGKSLPLEVLNKSGGEALARAYLNVKGIAIPDNNFIENVSARCHHNPLSIRITIDLYASGEEISFAINKSEKEVLEFSFINLIENLTELENNILEVIFALENPTRSEISSVLQADLDDIAIAIGRLSKTSLLSRNSNGEYESYNLGNSIRDLLRAFPRNLTIRINAAKWASQSNAIRDSSLKIQREKNISPLEVTYISEHATALEVDLCRQVMGILNSKFPNNNLRVEVEQNINNAIKNGNNSSLIFRLHGFLNERLDDKVTASKQYLKAIALDLNDPAPRLAYVLLNRKESPLSLYEHTSHLYKSGWTSSYKSNANRADLVMSLHLFVCNVCEKFDEVLSITNDCEKLVALQPSLTIGRASALRRISDFEFNHGEIGSNELGLKLAECASLLQLVFDTHGPLRYACGELRKFIEELDYYQTKEINFHNDDVVVLDKLKKLLNYCKNYYIDLRLDFRLIEKILWQIDGQSIEVLRKNDLSDIDFENFIKNGYIRCKVKNGIQRRYFFVKDEFGNDYYVNKDVIKNNIDSLNQELFPNQLVFIKTEDTRAVECVFV